MKYPKELQVVLFLHSLGASIVGVHIGRSLGWDVDICGVILSHSLALGPALGPIRTECRILKHVVASAAESEVGGLFHNGQTAVPLRITLHELGFTQPPTPIKTDNSAAEGIVTATVRQKRSKAMDMQFYWMKDRVKQKEIFVY